MIPGNESEHFYNIPEQNFFSSHMLLIHEYVVSLTKIDFLMLSVSNRENVKVTKIKRNNLKAIFHGYLFIMCWLILMIVDKCFMSKYRGSNPVSSKNSWLLHVLLMGLVI